MLDFLLVLGRVPGTDLQITFNEIVIGLAMVSVWYFRRKIRRLLKSTADSFVSYRRHRAWRRRQLSLSI